MPAGKFGIYLVEFCDGKKYVFGNNYKPWYTHASELALSRYRNVSRHQIVKSVRYSRTRFYDDGGLKYASEDAYQDVINDVAASTGRKAIKFENIEFELKPLLLVKLDKEIEKW